MKNIFKYFLLIILFITVYSCDDDKFEPSPEEEEVIKPEENGFNNITDSLNIPAEGNAIALSFRSVGSGWRIEKDNMASWISEISPESGESGNNIVSVKAAINDGMTSRQTSINLINDLGDKININIIQHTYESQRNRESDSLALVEVYNSLSNYSWAEPWDFKLPMSDWTGVILEEVNGELRVVELSLRDWNMAGHIPNEIGNLAELRKLTIGGSISESMPSRFTKLRKLEEFYFIGNGNTPDWTFPESAHNLKSLRILECGNIRINEKSFENLYKIKSLERVSLNIPDSFDMPSGIANLSNLKELIIDGCGITSLPEDIGLLSELIELDCSSCTNLSNLPSSMGDFAKLEILNLSDCEKLVSLSDNFGSITSLKELYCKNCYSLAELPQTFGNLSNISIIEMKNNVLKSLPSGFNNLTSLTYLDITSYGDDDNTISGSVVEYFSNLSNLEVLYAENNDISGDISFIKNCIKIHKLSMNGNNLSGELNIEENIKSTSIEELKLNDNNLSGTLEGLTKLINLKTLELRNNNIRGELPADINLCSTLNYIDLENNLITGSLPASLLEINWGWWEYLLNVRDNHMSGPIPKELTESKWWGNAWGSWNIDTNIIPQKDGYGFDL